MYCKIAGSEALITVKADLGLIVYNSRSKETEVHDFIQMEDDTAGSAIYEGTNIECALKAAVDYLEESEPRVIDNRFTGSIDVLYRCVSIQLELDGDGIELLAARNIEWHTLDLDQEDLNNLLYKAIIKRA